ncbi:MAG TPA: hypothetical protein VKB35_01455 [Ktedonobacteraceae bacterium]|nr:hypothetical protein [Ktedonobacteraceae bacterium]
MSTIISPTPSSSPALSPTPSAALAPLHITGVAIGVSPNNVSSIACGASTNLVFTATITSNSGNLGGQVPYTWSINHSNTSGSVTFTPGQTSKTVAYTLSGVVIQLSSPSAVSGSITVGNPGSSITSSTVGLAGVCRLPGPFQVVHLSISTNPASISTIACGTTINVIYTATVTIAPDSNAGTVQLVWNYGGTSHPAASVVFAPTATVNTVSVTLSGKLGRFTGFPRPVSIASTSPNAVSSAAALPSGTCS